MLITGDAGFIGGHLCDKCTKEGCDVLCLGNFIKTTEKNLHFNASGEQNY